MNKNMPYEGRGAKRHRIVFLLSTVTPTPPSTFCVKGKLPTKLSESRESIASYSVGESTALKPLCFFHSFIFSAFIVYHPLS